MFDSPLSPPKSVPVLAKVTQVTTSTANVYTRALTSSLAQDLRVIANHPFAHRHFQDEHSRARRLSAAVCHDMVNKRLV